MLKADKNLIRDINTSSVIETIIKYAPVSRIDISKITGLTKGTITSIAQSLLDTGLIEETETSGSGVGRKSILLMLKSQCGFAASLEAGKDFLRLAAFDMGGQKIYDAKTPLKSEFLLSIKAAVDACLDSLPQSDYGLIGISAICEASGSGPVFPFSPDLSMPELEKFILEEYGIPVFIIERASLGVLGENLYSMRTGSLALVNASEQVSMGLMSEGRLFSGGRGHACNLGHMIIDPSGPSCSCGSRGCFGQYASLKAMLDLLSKKKGRTVGFEEFCHLFNLSDSDAREAASHFIKYMSLGLKNIIRLYDPEIIVINSAVTMYFDEIFLRLKNSLGNSKGVLYRSMLKDDAPLYGGAVVCISKFLKIENFVPSMCYFSHLKLL